MKHILFTVFFLASSLANSQPVVINGSAPGAEGKKIRLLVPSDLLTFVEKQIAGSDIGPDGSFELSFALDKTRPAYLSIDFHRAELFLEPGMGYELEVDPMNYGNGSDLDPFLNSQDLGIRFTGTGPDELNFLIRRFDTRYDSFLLVNFNALYRDRNKARIDTFRVHTAREFPEPVRPYLADYIRYRIAVLEQLAQAKSQAQLAKAYFSDAPVLYENPAYMDLFNQFFTKYITATSRVLKFKDYNAILKGPDSYGRMMKTLAEDTLLKKPQLREMVLLKGLSELFRQPGYDPESILLAVQTLSEKSNFPENRLVARNLITLLNHLRPGTPAPDFTLAGIDQEKISLRDLIGKPVLLGFWTTGCQECLAEMERMKELYVKYGDRVHFVSISADKEFLRMKYFLNLKKDFSWTFLHIGDSLDVLKDYDVRSFPLFVLIDENGNIFRCPAELPSAGLEVSVQKLSAP
jgi:peroxiredoxin